MLANMTISLIMHKRIETTLAKAKALRVYAEPIINRAKKDDTNSRRVVFSYLQNKEAVTELFREISQKIADRPGGYLRIIKLGIGFALKLVDTDGWVYNVIYAVLIIAFTIFYTAVTVNPQQMADDLKRNNGFIPGVKPGKPTADYIDTVMSRITWPGALFLTIVAVMPAFARLFGVNQAFAQFFGGTSLIILIGVVLDTLQQIESHLLMRHYDGLLKTGRIKGRSGMGAY